ncbi:putative GPI anchored protein [Trematosphaeria pertusa]|uniref:Putative GPI anchored protein n=1 Tax=Trematosphaeria pertusa TaxID=390896 RepID=A0A6A6I3F7_9PLEO|nr:putative GPI anchored protein [Trematosphaeria pertusa]KAF2244423.1 putative GPI anchored protein [Trematosphaeria pertusa]
MDCRIKFFSLLFTISLLPAATSVGPPLRETPKCRFSPQYSLEDVLSDSDAFVWDLLYWEGHFHQNNVGYNQANGMTFDGTLLDPITGTANFSGLHPFSAASKESLHVMILAHAVAGSSFAARFLSPEEPQSTPRIAYEILEKKLKTYVQFNQTYPGFGGFLPWFLSNETDIRPTLDWVNRVPALDNGELLWAVYGAVQALERSNQSEFTDLARGWQAWLDYTKTTATEVFYNGTGRVCAVTAIGNQSEPLGGPDQSYMCEGNQTLNDPYEGELFTWWLYLFSDLNTAKKEELWTVKRTQVVATEWHSNTSLGDVTVQKGYWFSSHEQWKLLEMPYTDVLLIKRIFHNAERARTCNSFLNGVPGMYASVNNVTDESGQILGYISNAGVPSISFLPVQELDVITPYSVFPTVLFDRNVGLAWWKNMVDGKGMQNLYGSTESERVDGAGISSFVSWDSKVTTVAAILGGVTDLVRDKMKEDGIYDTFVEVSQREYTLAFGDRLEGEDVELCLPNVGVPDTGKVVDYESCR